MTDQQAAVIRRTSDEPVFAEREAPGMMEVASTRAAQEVQAAMIVAKKFPRDENAALARIMQACKRKTLADQSLYAYPRGGETVTGPSIRLAETLAQNWGNIDFGIVELEQRLGESTVMSYAWDLETNTRQTKIFTVRHERHTRNGSRSLSDPRDIYELTANQGARRLRACILGVIPGDVIDSAIEQCEVTMKGNTQEPIIDRARKMVVAFADLQVTLEMIEKRLGHKLDVISEAELVNLRKIYRSLRDNMAEREQFFPVDPSPVNGNGGAKTPTQELSEKFGKKTGEAAGTTPAPVVPVQDTAPQGRAHQSQPADAGPQDDNALMSTWDGFSSLLDEAARAHGIEPDALDAFIGQRLLRSGKKGKPDTTTMAWRVEVLASVRAGKLD